MVNLDFVSADAVSISGEIPSSELQHQDRNQDSNKQSKDQPIHVASRLANGIEL